MVESFNKQFAAAAEKQEEEVVRRLLADSEERESVHNRLLKVQGDKDVAEALTKLQKSMRTTAQCCLVASFWQKRNWRKAFMSS